MDTSKIIKGVVNSGRYTVTAPIIKEDYGLYLQIEGVELPQTYEVDFSNDEHHGTSVTMIGNSDGVLIPHQFIDTGKDIFAFLYHVGANYGRTVYKFRIPNKCRPDRTEEEPTPEEQSTIDQAISALNSAVAQTAQDVIDADASAQSAQGYAEQAETAKTNAQTYANNASASATSASQSATASANSASASAQSASQAEQTKTAVEDLADDAQASASASAQSATASANSASQALSSAQSATASASSAQGYASQAQTSAQNASSKATEASTSAQTASNKASESAQSATNASQSAQTAEQAKTASQTAQGLAESARDSAISAKNDAESARDEAQNLVDGISGKVEQIDSNTERIESLEDDRYKPYVTDTASGAVASFPDGADDIPLKSLVVNIDPVQDTSSGDPSPENICPISGWTGMTVNAAGKNIVDISRFATEYPNYCSFSNGVLTVTSNSALYSRGIDVDIPQGSVLNWTITDGTSVNARLRIVYEDGTVRSHSSPIPLIVSKRITALRFDWGTGGTFTVSNFQAELGNSATSYEPYQGRTIPISWQTEAGTVYGGKLDVLSGKLTVEKYYGDLSGASIHTQNDEYKLVKKSGFPYAKGTSGGAAISNVTNKFGNIPSSSYNSTKIQFPITGTGMIYASMPIDFDVSAVTFCYELATPVEIQLDGHTINSLYGQNNIFADTGDCAVEYRADTKLYIERLTAPDSADMIADANITSGQYFMVGNSLFKATANIASGGQVIVGTNAVRKSLSEALNEINA